MIILTLINYSTWCDKCIITYMCCDFTLCTQLLTAWRSWGPTSSNGVHSWRKAILWRHFNVPSHRLYGLWCNLCRRPVPSRSTRWVISCNSVGNLWNNSNILYNTYSLTLPTQGNIWDSFLHSTNFVWGLSSSQIFYHPGCQSKSSLLQGDFL